MNPYLNVNEVSNQVPQVSFKRFDKNVYCQGGQNFCDSVLIEMVVAIEAISRLQSTPLSSRRCYPWSTKLIILLFFLNTGSSYLLIPPKSSQWMIWFLNSFCGPRMEYGLTSQPAFKDVESVTHDQGHNIFYDPLARAKKFLGGWAFSDKENTVIVSINEEYLTTITFSTYL